MAEIVPINQPSTTRVDLNNEGVAGTDQNSQKLNQPLIVDLITLEKLTLQTVPLEVNVDPNANWVALASLGRNIPGWQFTGAEETITFDITWYCDDESRQDVIKKCKWLTSLSLADGYDAEPHPIQFIFGELFKDSKFIITQAPYKLSLFDRAHGMMPHLANQSITLKKISETNTKRVDHLKITK